MVCTFDETNVLDLRRAAGNISKLLQVCARWRKTEKAVDGRVNNEDKTLRAQSSLHEWSALAAA